ncbi:MAG: type II toxin-antitoxin system Phd/YefM family antitoxin [Sphingomonas phyllosphaerae]
MNAVSYSEARANLNAMIDKVVADRAPLAITRFRREGAVLISESEWAAIEERLGAWHFSDVRDQASDAICNE